MITTITSKVTRPVGQDVGIALDVKEIIQTFTPLGAAKIISSRFIKECKPSEIFIAGKCIMFIESVLVSVGTGKNSLVVSETVSAVRSIIL